MSCKCKLHLILANYVEFESYTVLTKTTSPNTIVYTLQKSVYIPPGCPICSGSYSTSITTQSVSNLNSAVAFSNQSDTACFHLRDSLYYNNCNRRTYSNAPSAAATVSNCLYAPTESIYYIEGLGGPYYQLNVNYTLYPLQQSYNLVYYSKQSGSCGTMVSTSIEENSTAFGKISIYPNPVANSLTIQSEQIFQDFNIVDLTGAVCLRGKLEGSSINTQTLSSGVYFLHIYSNTAVGSAKIIKE